MLFVKVDKQTCDIKLESWGYNDKKIVFKSLYKNQSEVEEDIASEINRTLHQHYFKVDFLEDANDGGYVGISEGKNCY